ncbi:hypothetical protein FRC12_025212 [Ceratobasidium sp. 428]|nr:hypothetical protein FRC12_025212 [Ceratobasidium sp. 428]
MPPHRFSRTSSARSTPLPSGRYAIPSTLPPTFGIHELFDWSTGASSASGRSASAMAQWLRNFSETFEKSVRVFLLYIEVLLNNQLQ